jgi:hypothetical protein
MNQDYYEFIRQMHQKQYQVYLLQMELKKTSRVNPTLRKRSQLYLSDLLLNIGQRIRPTEFKVHIHPGQPHDGTLEIKAEGC